MRPTWRHTMGVATLAVLAATAAAPSAFGQDVTRRPIVGSNASSAASATAKHTVTLVSGDVVVVEGAGTTSPSVTVLPRQDGTVPTVETRRVGNDIYVYPEDASAALAADKVDEELFNVTGLIAQGYDDASTKTIPLITTYTTRVDARTAPPAPKAATTEQVPRSVDGVAMAADKDGAADIVLQKSTREGFGLGVAEAMWKSKPVIGGFAGGITAQIVWGVTGYTVNSVEGAAFRARQLLADPDLRARIGAAAREHVRQNFLLTRHLGDTLALMATLL